MPLQAVWTDVPPVNSQAKERLSYPTQKPEALLDRIIRASSNEGDLVLDCFCGSGTTAAVAEKLNRRWIACDLGRFAIHTTRKRLLGIPDVRPFVVQNLGKYERQLWQTGQFAADGPESPEQAAARHRAYTEFILSLYHAQPIHGYTWLHGTRKRPDGPRRRRGGADQRRGRAEHGRRVQEGDRHRQGRSDDQRPRRARLGLRLRAKRDRQAAGRRRRTSRSRSSAFRAT